MPPQLQEVYAELGQMLEHPETCGLGDHVAPALAERLTSMRRMLQEAIRELELAQSDHDFAVDLAEETDEEPARPEA